MVLLSAIICRSEAWVRCTLLLEEQTASVALMLCFCFSKMQECVSLDVAAELPEGMGEES